MGWWGSSNGWYQIQTSFNAGGYTKIKGGVFNIVPVPELKLETNTDKIKLSWQLPSTIQADSFKLEMYKDATDWKTIGTFSQKSYFEVQKNDSSKYSFRLRAYYSKFPYIIAWSNYAKYEKQVTAIKKYQNNVFTIYPNPAKEQLFIKINREITNIDVKIMDLAGRILFSEKLYGKNVINISDFKIGTYFIMLQNSNLYARKIFIKNE